MRPTGHMRERSPGSWELRYSLGTNPATGKRRVATTTVEGNRGCRERIAAVAPHARYRRACRPNADDGAGMVDDMAWRRPRGSQPEDA